MDKNAIIAALEKEELELQEKIKSLRQTIITLRQSMVIDDTLPKLVQINGSVQHPASQGASPTVPTKYQGFNKTKSWREKVAFVFKTENRFLHYREIIDIICSLIPGTTKESLKNSVSPALSFLKNEGVIVKVKYGESNINSFWGSKNWLNEDGSIKAGYEYDKSQITLGGSAVDYEI